MEKVQNLRPAAGGTGRLLLMDLQRAKGSMIVGIDIGTQSLKVAVTDHEPAKCCGEAATPYRPQFPAAGLGGAGSLPCGNSALGPTIARALAEAGAAPAEIAALGVCGQLDGCVAVDADGRALTPCLSGWIAAPRRRSRMSPAALVRTRAGVVLDAGHMAAKIRWLKRHDPRAAAAARFHQPVSYLVERLTGAAVMDHALASTTMAYALDRRGFDSALLDVL